MEILIVDDDPTVLEFCRRGISGEEFEVSAAPSGEAAAKLLRSRKFDILLADIIMDPPDGLALAEMVRKSHAGTDVILITGYPSGDSTINALKAGVYDYIVKPIDLLLLKAALRRCVERREIRGRLAEAGEAARSAARHLKKLSERLSKLRREDAPDHFRLERDGCQALAESALKALEEIWGHHT